MKKIKIIILVLCVFLSKNIKVSAKTYTSYNVGDVVTLSEGTDKTSEWRVIEASSSSSDKVKLFKEINVPTLYDNNTKLKAFSQSSKLAYADSDIYTFFNGPGKYVDTLNLGTNLINIGLISLDELKALGCTSTGCNSSSYQWVVGTKAVTGGGYGSGYWTSTIGSGNWGILVVNYDSKSIAETGASYTGAGTRPVITVSKEAVNGGVKAPVTRTFTNPEIVCIKDKDDNKTINCNIKIDDEVKNAKFDLSVAKASLLTGASVAYDDWDGEVPSWSQIDGAMTVKNVEFTKTGTSNHLLSLSIDTIENIKEDEIKVTLFNVTLTDENGDYQIIDKIEKTIEIKNGTTELPPIVVENPKTGQNSYILLLITILGLGTAAYIKLSKKTKRSK